MHPLQVGPIPSGHNKITILPERPLARSFVRTATWPKKLTQAEVPQSVLPDSVFKAVVKIPYDTGVQELGADGSQVPLQVGAVVMLPDGFHAGSSGSLDR